MCQLKLERQECKQGDTRTGQHWNYGFGWCGRKTTNERDTSRGNLPLTLCTLCTCCSFCRHNLAFNILWRKMSPYNQLTSATHSEFLRHQKIKIVFKVRKMLFMKKIHESFHDFFQNTFHPQPWLGSVEKTSKHKNLPQISTPSFFTLPIDDPSARRAEKKIGLCVLCWKPNPPRVQCAQAPAQNGPKGPVMGGAIRGGVNFTEEKGHKNFLGQIFLLIPWPKIR